MKEDSFGQSTNRTMSLVYETWQRGDYAVHG